MQIKKEYVVQQTTKLMQQQKQNRLCTCKNNIWLHHSDKYNLLQCNIDIGNVFIPASNNVLIFNDIEYQQFYIQNNCKCF